MGKKTSLLNSCEQSHRMAYVYSAYGLHICSEILLPELVPCKAPINVTIHFGEIHQPFSANSDHGNCLWATREEACFQWENVGRILIRNGCEIIVDAEPDVDPQELRLYILGVGLGVLLLQGSHWVFHASVMEIAGEAVAFIGESGWGKSTMAASLYKLGHRLVADDLLLLHLTPETPFIIPGFPQIKLWLETAVALDYSPKTLHQLAPNYEKFALRISDRFVTSPLPLKRIYLLDRGETLQSRIISPKEAMFELMPHWYGARFGPELLEASGIGSHFEQCATVANNIEVFRLECPDNLAAVTEIAKFVEEDVQHH